MVALPPSPNRLGVRGGSSWLLGDLTMVWPFLCLPCLYSAHCGSCLLSHQRLGPISAGIISLFIPTHGQRWGSGVPFASVLPPTRTYSWQLRKKCWHSSYSDQQMLLAKRVLTSTLLTANNHTSLQLFPDTHRESGVSLTPGSIPLCASEIPRGSAIPSIYHQVCELMQSPGLHSVS